MKVTLSFIDPARAQEFQGFCDALQATPDEVISALLHLYVHDAVWFHVVGLAKGWGSPTAEVIEKLRRQAEGSDHES